MRRRRCNSKHVYIETPGEGEEGDHGFREADFESGSELSPPSSSPTPDKILRELYIVTWGLRLDPEPSPPVTFNFSRFYAIAKHKEQKIKTQTGLDKEVQDSIRKHPLFTHILYRIVNYIEERDLNHISMACNYGRHRSVAWAELLKEHCYPNATIHHMGLERAQ